MAFHHFPTGLIGRWDGNFEFPTGLIGGWEALSEFPTGVIEGWEGLSEFPKRLIGGWDAVSPISDGAYRGVGRPVGISETAYRGVGRRFTNFGWVLSWGGMAFHHVLRGHAEHHFLSKASPMVTSLSLDRAASRAQRAEII